MVMERKKTGATASALSIPPRMVGIITREGEPQEDAGDTGSVVAAVLESWKRATVRFVTR